MKTLKEYIIEALENLGGEAHYSDIYDYILKNKAKLPKSWKAIIRATIESYSINSDRYNGGENLFYTVEGLGKGIWGLNDFVPKEYNVDLTEDDIEFPEGKKLLRKHIIRERNPKIIRLAKKQFLSKNGKLFCEICGFEFEKVYGDIGQGFIEAHHSKAISLLDENEKTKIDDIIMVCSNCHRMLHRKRPWLDKQNLTKLLNDNKSLDDE